MGKCGGGLQTLQFAQERQDAFRDRLQAASEAGCALAGFLGAFAGCGCAAHLEAVFARESEAGVLARFCVLLDSRTEGREDLRRREGHGVDGGFGFQAGAIFRGEV